MRALRLLPGVVVIAGLLLGTRPVRAEGERAVRFEVDGPAGCADEARLSSGSMVKAPKAGAGPTTVLACDTSPTAIAVDAHSVYWSDAAGYIKSVPK